MPDFSRSTALTVLLAGLALSIGCGEPAEKPASEPRIFSVGSAGLPELGDYTPPLDGGRIEVAGPAGWELAPRTKGYVVRFVRSAGEQYPMILMKAAEASTKPLSRQNVARFAESLAASGSARAVAIGERFGVLQRKRGKAPNTIDQILERLIFTTVLGDRLYTLELRTRQDRLREHQDSLFAVAAGLRPLDGAAREAATAKQDVKEEQESSGGKKEGGNEEEKPAGDAGQEEEELEEIFGQQ